LKKFFIYQSFYNQKTLVPTRWFNSIKRGLKLEEIYQAPPCLGGRAREIMKEEAQKSSVEKQ
jgi:hypothetical protein